MVQTEQARLGGIPAPQIYVASTSDKGLDLGSAKMADQYDLIVLGSGPGGYVAAIGAAQLGVVA